MSINHDFSDEIEPVQRMVVKRNKPNNNKGGFPRIIQELRSMIKEPTDGILAFPDDNNLLNWYFVIDGPDHVAFKGGKFFGRCILPKDYPFSPPSLFMDTPSYVFSNNEHICMTNTAFHSETWTPQWTIVSLLNSLRMFFLTRYHQQEIQYAGGSAKSKLTFQRMVRTMTDASIFTTYRMKEFRLMFPDVANEFKLLLQQETIDFFNDTTTNPDRIKLLPPGTVLPLQNINATTNNNNNNNTTTTTTITTNNDKSRVNPPNTNQSSTNTNTNTKSTLKTTQPIAIPRSVCANSSNSDTTGSSTILSKIVNDNFSDTSSRTSSPIITPNILETDFSPIEQIYIKYVLGQISFEAKHPYFFQISSVGLFLLICLILYLYLF